MQLCILNCSQIISLQNMYVCVCVVCVYASAFFLLRRHFIFKIFYFMPCIKVKCVVYRIVYFGQHYRIPTPILSSSSAQIWCSALFLLYDFVCARIHSTDRIYLHFILFIFRSRSLLVSLSRLIFVSVTFIYIQNRSI